MLTKDADRNGDDKSFRLEEAEAERLRADNVALSAENAALKAEIEMLRTASGASGRDVERDEAVGKIVSGEVQLRERELAKLSAQLDALLRSSSEVRYLINADWSELAQLSGGGFIPDTSAGNPNWLDEYIPQDHRDMVRDEIRRAIAAKDTYHLEHKVNRVDGTVGWALSRAVPLFDENGEILNWMGAASDITDRKTAEEAQHVLNQELAHRIKNLFSMVQALISQSLRQAASTDEARATIGARLAALGRAQDMLTKANFAATDVQSLVSAALEPHLETSERIVTDGPLISLGSQQALGLALAVHELATNAVKYGSLSSDTGSVAVSWRMSEGQFAFEWLETGGPQVVPPTRQGFGSRLIEDIIASYFYGQSEIAFAPEGVRFRLTGSAGVH